MTPKGQQTESKPLEYARAWAPASISNLGPGFDCLGVAIEEWGDLVEATPNSSGQVTIAYSESSKWQGAPSWETNTAGVSARAVLDMLDTSIGVKLVITKNVSPGSGVGISAASAVAAAWAVNLLFGNTFSKAELIPAILEGEAVASGSVHGDNALPSLFGGVTISSSADPTVYMRLRYDTSPFLTICLPQLQVNTRESRTRLPDDIPFATALHRASSLAILVTSIQNGNWADAGVQIMSDDLIEPLRAANVPGYKRMKSRAMELGAYGVALSGSGPAVFTISETRDQATQIMKELISIVESEGQSVRGLVTEIEQLGARQV